MWKYFNAISVINNVIIFRLLLLIYARNNLILNILSNRYFYKLKLDFMILIFNL